jgi:hypothetical protein
MVDGPSHGQTHLSWELQGRLVLSESFAASNGTFNAKSCFNKLGMLLRGVVPGGPIKVSAQLPGYGEVTDSYQFPSQEKCRTALMENLGLVKSPWM